MPMPVGNVHLFSYGTLQQPKVQLASFGRLLTGRPDRLQGYSLLPLNISDRTVVELSGAAVHMIACRTGDASDVIAGMVYEITAAELEAADAYEVDAYARAEVKLASGLMAFVYTGAPIEVGTI